MTGLLIADNLRETLINIRIFLGNPADLRILLPDEKDSLAVIYLKAMVDEKALFLKLEDFLRTTEHISSTVQFFHENRSLNEALLDLPKGHALFIQKKDSQYIIFNLPLPGWQLRPIEEPISERLVRGPREGFTESLETNTSMVRRWIKDRDLHIEEMIVGLRTQTAVRLLYLVNVAKPDLVTEVKKRIVAIKIDGILESGYLEQLITDNRRTIFPLLQSTERSDKVTAGILEGRIAILVDKSPFALLVPTTINELYQSPEDYYYNYYLGSFLRFFRLFGNNLAIALPGLYVALAYANPELLPINFFFAIAKSRIGVPYPLYIEVLILELFEEIFREAGLRLPGNIHQILGIAVGVSLTFAAIQTHLVSGATLVVSAISAAALFSAPNHSVGIPWRIFKFMLIIGAIYLGIVGLTLTGIFILAHAATLTSFGISYLAPWAPIQQSELIGDAVLRFPLWWRKQRPKTYEATDRQRVGKTKPDKNNH